MSRGHTQLAPVAVAPGAGALALVPLVEAALRGTGPALLPYAAGSPPPDPDVPENGSAFAADLPDGLALVVGTSGSTGRPKPAMLTAAALRASAEATHRRLGGPGRWVLALPVQHIAGLQVLVRSIVAGTVPVAVGHSGGTAAAFAAATSELDAGAGVGAGRCYTALVPTQLVRLLADPDGARALRAYDAVLVGAASTPPAVLAEAERAGVKVVLTYGMSETAGGCVYDGVALDCSAFRLAQDGRVELTGATLAAGYLGRPDLTAATFTGSPPWFRTDDLGSLDAEGRLVIHGRVDDLISTGGLKVAAGLVEGAALAHLPEVTDAVAVGVPDPEWGQRVGLAVVLRPGGEAPSLVEVRARLAAVLPGYALPTLLRALPSMPLRGPGKPDRAAIVRSLRTMSVTDGTMGTLSR